MPSSQNLKHNNQLRSPQSYRTTDPKLPYSKVVSGQIPANQPRKNINNNNDQNFSAQFCSVLAISNDAGVDQNLLAKAFRQALPALKSLNDANEKACVIFEAVQSLSICFWNANGLRSKICEVRDFVSEQNPDVLLVQEAKLQPVCGLDPLIVNYRLHKDDRNNFPRSRIGGGTAIYYKNNYVHNRVPLPTLQYMDATAIEIKFNNFSPIRIVSAYARNTPENNRKFPDKDFLKILNSGQNIIIAGDLNAAHRTGVTLDQMHLAMLSANLLIINRMAHLAVNHPLEKAEVIADSLQKQFEPNTEAENDRFTARTQRKIKRFLDAPTCLDLKKNNIRGTLHSQEHYFDFPEQHGFVTQCSTVTQLLRVTELIHHGFQNNQVTGMLFVDIAKAFDKIWHGLLSKMMRLGFSDQLIKIIHSYLNSREFKVRVENSLSTPRPILSGVPQGSLLGLKLFNLYINAIPKAVEVHLTMYADNTAIFTQNIYNCNIILSGYKIMSFDSKPGLTTGK
ncbi:probable RNA-directed DNA polymerase from transposon BS [Trichonephila clavipes]|nr:probable RNA-directed DNA polymerase from transposon BS [Trichonephila clavipes]